MCYICVVMHFFFFKQKTAYEMRISDWSSDVCSSDLARGVAVSYCRPVGGARPWPQMTGMMTIAPRTMSLILLDLGRSPSNANAMFDPWAPENSVLREKVVEHLLLSDLSRYLLTERGTPFEVMRAVFDPFDYVLVIEFAGLQSKVQSKR